MARTEQEIETRLHNIERRDFFGFELSDLLNRLPFDKARKFFRDPSLYEDGWKILPRDDMSVLVEMQEYMPFALEKALGHRGLSAIRSISHYRAWLYLLGEDANMMVLFAEDEGNFKNYGMPILKAICDKYHFPFPIDDAALNMASGKQCVDGCEEGCGV